MNFELRIMNLELEVDKRLHISGNELVHDYYCYYSEQYNCPDGE